MNFNNDSILNADYAMSFLVYVECSRPEYLLLDLDKQPSIIYITACEFIIVLHFSSTQVHHLFLFVGSVLLTPLLFVYAYYVYLRSGFRVVMFAKRPP